MLQGYISTSDRRGSGKYGYKIFVLVLLREKKIKKHFILYISLNQKRTTRKCLNCSIVIVFLNDVWFERVRKILCR